MSQKVPSCTVCGGREFDCSDGLYYCIICSTQSQAIRDEHVQYTEAYEGRFGGIGVKADKVKKEKIKKKDYGRPWRTHEAFQMILKAQVEAFIRLGAKSEVLDIAFRLWAMYLGRCGVAFTELVKPATSNMQLKGRSRDMYPGTVADPRIKPVRFLASKKRRNPQFTTKRMLAQNELLEAMMTEKFYEGDNPYADESHTVPAMMEQETSLQEERESRSSITTDFEGLPLFLDVKEDARSDRVINCITMSKVLCLAVLAVMYTNPQVTPSDVFGWIKDGRVPYMQAVDLLPDDMHFSIEDRDLFYAKHVPTPETIVQLCGHLAVYLQLDAFPSVDIGLIASRYMNELDLPCELHGFVSSLIARRRPMLRLSRLAGSWLINPSVLAMAYIVVVLKLLFHLDDNTEKQWSEYARHPSVRKQYDCPLFVWEDWVSAAETRMTVNRAGYFPADLTNLKTMVDVESGMNHFDTVVEPHLRFSANSRHYTQLRLGQMQQMPEEIRQLQQQACLSSSQHDEMPHVWRRCPSRKQFRHTQQQNTPRFFNSTVQYVIDCNRSTCSASEGATHSLPSNEESTTVSDELTAVNNSPSRKRPRLAASTRSSVASPQSATLETSDIDSRLMQRIISSDACDDGPLLHSQPQPPRTLTSYPVYKPANMKVEINVSDRVDRPRPLSYRWLVGLCSGHIHAKPDIIERYVERLELLHVVPVNLSDPRERALRAALARRLKIVRQVAEIRDSVDDKPKRPRRRRRRCKPPPTMPPRKLL